MDNFFIAYERYLADQKYRKYRAIKQGSSKDVTKSASFATKVNTRTPNSVSRCSLCSKLENQESNHPLFRCPRFDSPKLKIEKLNQLSGCIKCGNLNHQPPQCKFKFQRKCKTCSKWHFDFLCSQGSTGSPKSKVPESETNMVKSEATSGVVVLPIVNCDSVLPTFSFYINKAMVRGLNDRCSQSSFVSERLVSFHNLKVIQDNVKLTINGFNKPQSYLSRVVELPVCLGQSVHTSLVVPEIKVNLNLPRLGSVMEVFLHKGYKLADSNLNENSNSVSDVDFLLGSDRS